MAVIEVSIVIRAPVKVCFDVARDIDLHTRSTAQTRERAIGGFTKGPIRMGQEVTWEAVHFGVRQTLTSRITAFNPPTHFFGIPRFAAPSPVLITITSSNSSTGKPHG
ncbi:MAG: hypothetical protein JO217_12880 [Acidobacteriaceae bacterium]|nr:hypothetical protein [Acidobacteriaceae bacterium]